MVVEWAATAAGLAKQARMAEMGFVVYSIIIFQFQTLLPVVLQKKFLSLNADKDFENIQVYDTVYNIWQLAMQLIYSTMAVTVTQ